MNGLTQSEAVAVGGILGGMFATIGIIALVFYVLLIVAWWKIFEKAGEPGWKSLIPVYNVYIMYKISGMKNWFWGMFAISLVLSIVSNLVQPGQSAPGYVAVITLICAIAIICISIAQVYKMAKAFGKGIGYTLGLIFLPNIFTLILGFGSAEYEGVE
mgnify:CR=1 FL=1